MISFSLLVNHTPWVPERVIALNRMMRDLNTPAASSCVKSFWVHDTDYREKGAIDQADPANHKPRVVDFTIAQWRWAAKQDCTHHLFMTDDLLFMPYFWDALVLMVSAKPEAIIGLMSNHPHAARVLPDKHWYRCNSWVVGPCYVVPHVHMIPLLAYAEEHGCVGQGWSDDSTLNEWVTFHGPKESWHPVPTIIKHDRAMLSTWAHTGHGDDYSHERVAWDQQPWFAPEVLTRSSFWEGDGPMWGLP